MPTTTMLMVGICQQRYKAYGNRNLDSTSTEIGAKDYSFGENNVRNLKIENNNLFELPDDNNSSTCVCVLFFFFSFFLFFFFLWWVGCLK